MAVLKTKKEIEALVDLFLLPNFNPFSGNTDPGTVYQTKINSTWTNIDFEAELEDEECSDEPFDNISKESGLLLARLGNDFLHDMEQQRFQNQNLFTFVANKIKSSLIRLARLTEQSTVSPDILEQERVNAWTTFQGVMESSISGTGVDNLHKLGSFLMCLNGLAGLGSKPRELAKQFALRFLLNNKNRQSAFSNDFKLCEDELD
ncbi:unnamed protein product [Lymnaea stagnalis]|uniref:Uncharacterized protein n=1 Tax=Lymnaea stagnalis TaxID=6523 RepID=A0AAV2IAT3_LYMST